MAPNNPIMVILLIMVLGVIVMLGIGTLQFSDVQSVENFNHTGYVIDIDFVGGGLGDRPQTIVRFDDGETITLRGFETEIPIKQNITLRYHDNGFDVYFLDNFTMAEEER